MFIPALDTHLTRWESDPNWREMMVDYGRAFLKAACALSPRVDLAEYQIVDGTTVLREFARNTKIRTLVESGGIRPSWYSPGGYLRALKEKMDRKESWISSAWPDEIRCEIHAKLMKGDISGPSECEDLYREMWEGLLYFEGLFANEESRRKFLRRSKETRVGFRRRLEHALKTVVQDMPEGYTDSAETARQLILDASKHVKPKDVDNRSAYIRVLESPVFRDDHPDSIPGEGYALAIQIVFKVSLLTFADPVSDGDTLDHQGSRRVPIEVIEDVPFPDVELSYALFDSVMGIESGFNLQISDEELAGLDALNWDQLLAIRESPLVFETKLGEARKSEEGKERYMEWLKRNLGSGVVRPVPSKSTQLIGDGLATVAGGAVANALGAEFRWVVVSAAVSGVLAETFRRVTGRLAERREWKRFGRAIQGIKSIGEQSGALASES